jgi:hypothetical protein
MVPLALCGTGIHGHGDEYDEMVAAGSRISFPNGWEMMAQFIKGSW